MLLEQGAELRCPPSEREGRDQVLIEVQRLQYVTDYRIEGSVLADLTLRTSTGKNQRIAWPLTSMRRSFASSS